jgi:murein DD-endopeptidase MepM/ murein hydrolase activator NlpD
MTPTRRLHACLALVLVGAELAIAPLSYARPADRRRLPAFASHVREPAPPRLSSEDRAAVAARSIEAPAASRRAPAAPTFAWPVVGRVSGPFGERRAGGRHPGMDIEGHIGAPVQAAVAGTVVSAGPASSGYAGYGNLVVVDVGGGMLAMYAHLSSWSVAAGQVVAVGDRIGAVGCSGMCTGPHLHFELRLAGVPVNPAAYLPAR